MADLGDKLDKLRKQKMHWRKRNSPSWGLVLVGLSWLWLLVWSVAHSVLYMRGL